MSWDDEERELNASADQDLGTVVSALDREGRYDEASILELCALTNGLSDDNWRPQPIYGVLHVDPLHLRTVTKEILETTERVLDSLHPNFNVFSVSVAPRRVPATWREQRADARLSDVGPNNQATYKTLPERAPARDRLRFGSQEEAKVYDALVKVQRRRPPTSTIGIMPGSGFRTVDRTVWPDFVITYKNRAAGIEVDGPRHYRRAAADLSRSRDLEDAGLLFVERIVVEDTSNPTELDIFVEKLLDRMLAR